MRANALQRQKKRRRKIRPSEGVLSDRLKGEGITSPDPKDIRHWRMRPKVKGKKQMKKILHPLVQRTPSV
ncbi:MAG: hypothetical protein A2W17_09770 [Planctomycetes bacterium RBG_16_41_13]|nr:MAG: hypothetical protein A2W17_09770 [Planctomycetes bacterium RBG_16_41_13]